MSDDQPLVDRTTGTVLPASKKPPATRRGLFLLIYAFRPSRLKSRAGESLAPLPRLAADFSRGTRAMSQAIVDPNELRRFAHQLKQFNAELEERLTTLAAQLHALSSTWRDQEQKKFADEFEQHLKLINRSIEATNEYAPFLLRKAERIEEYLQQK
jgi:uncharacterized protein YukE